MKLLIDHKTNGMKLLINCIDGGWKHGKVYKKSSYLQSNQKIVQFLTQAKESILKIILNNIIKPWCSSLSL
jgi:hypothetical protein